MAAISGKTARIRQTAAAATNSTNEAATLSTDGVTLSIDSTARRHWDRLSTAIKVFDHAVSTSVAVASTDITINHVQGQVTFDAARSTASTYKLDVDFLTASYLSGGRSWSVDINTNMLDITTFSTAVASPVFRSYTPGLNDATISIARLYQSDTTAPVFWDTLNAASSNFLVELIPDGDTGNRYEAFARISRFSPSVEIDGTADEGVDLQVDGTLYYTT